jgi:hypothetical protein
MKKLLIVLSFFLASNVVAQVQSFEDQVKEIVVGHNKYKIAVKFTHSGHRIYIPMRKVYNGKILREWVMSDMVYRSRQQAFEVIQEWKEEEEQERKLKRVEYIRIK